MINSKKTIMLLTDCLVDPSAGGAERKIYQLAEQLAKRNFRVILASLDCEGTSPLELVSKIGCELAVFKVKRIYGLSGLQQGFRFLKYLKNAKVGLLMTYHFSSDIWGTYFARLAKVPVIVSNRRDMGFWRKRWHVWAYRMINRSVKKMIVVSNAVKDQIVREEKVDAQKIEVIYNGVALASKAEAPGKDKLRSELKIRPDELVVMHVANFKPVKGHDYLIEAFGELAKKYSHIKLVLIGEDEFNGALQEKCARLGISDHVAFLGKRDDVRSLLAIADICVLPSLSEGMSNAVLEYMDAGKPVVATRVGGNPETVEESVTGLLVEPKNVQQLREAMEELILNPHMRARMGEAGRERAKRVFDIEAMYRKYEEFIMGLLK